MKWLPPENSVIGGIGLAEPARPNGLPYIDGWFPGGRQSGAGKGLQYHIAALTSLSTPVPTQPFTDDQKIRGAKGVDRQGWCLLTALVLPMGRDQNVSQFSVPLLVSDLLI